MPVCFNFHVAGAEADGSRSGGIGVVPGKGEESDDEDVDSDKGIQGSTGILNHHQIDVHIGV